MSTRRATLYPPRRYTHIFSPPSVSPLSLDSRMAGPVSATLFRDCTVSGCPFTKRRSSVWDGMDTELNAAMLSVLSTQIGQSMPVILRIIAVISNPASVFRQGKGGIIPPLVGEFKDVYSLLPCSALRQLKSRLNLRFWQDNWIKDASRWCNGVANIAFVPNALYQPNLPNQQSDKANFGASS